MWNDKIIKQELGEKHCKSFKNFFRYAKERCFNKNNKDYSKYKNLFNFEDYLDYFNSCYSIYKESIEKYPGETLSIDRIDSNKGYTKGNIRFVPIKINLQNKEQIHPVMAVNIKTHQILEANSIKEMAGTYFDSKCSSIFESINSNGIYKNEWKIFLII